MGLSARPIQFSSAASRKKARELRRYIVDEDTIEYFCSPALDQKYYFAPISHCLKRMPLLSPLLNHQEDLSTITLTPPTDAQTQDGPICSMERTAFALPACAKIALINAEHCNRDPLRKGGLLPATRSRRHLVHCTLPQEQSPLLELRNVNYRPPFNYDRVVFEQMNFKIFPGEFVILIGENGAGKSTALSIMIGNIRLPKRDGSLHWKGNESKASKMIRRIGVVMQNPSDYFLMPNVLDELISGRPKKTPADVRRVLQATGLNDISLVAHPKSLSGGQARRLALAGQLMREPLPELFVLDEPLAGVDWTARRDLVELLGSLKSQFSIIIVSHEPGELLEYADRVVEVKRGGMYDVSKDIIKRAIEVRRTRTAQARAKAFRDAEAFKARKQL